MSTLKLENIGHPDAVGNALELGADGRLTVTLGINGPLTINGNWGTNAGSGLILKSSLTDDNGIIHEQANGTKWFTGQETSNPQDYEFWNYNGSNWFKRFSISEEGYTHTPYHPSFSAYNTTLYQPGAGVDAVKPFDTVRYNVGGHFNTSNYRFTAPISGTYHFTWGGTLQFTTADGYATSYLIINGSSAGTARVRDSQTSGGAYYAGAMGSEYHQLSAGDYVEVWCYSQNGGVVFHSNEFVFMGRLVG